LAKIRLRSGSEEESAAPVPRIRSIDRPDVDILLLCALDRGIEIRARQSKSPEKIVDPRRDQEYGAPVGGRRPPLHQIQNRERGAGNRTSTAERQAQSLGGKLVAVGEVLREHGRAIARVGHGNIRGALGWPARNAFRSSHWLAMPLSSESSITTARYKWKCCGPASPTACNSGYACENS
jgi:hypothetical protein